MRWSIPTLLLVWTCLELWKYIDDFWVELLSGVIAFGLMGFWWRR